MLDKLKEAKWNDCAPSGHELNKWIILVFGFIIFNYLNISFFVFKCHPMWKTVDVTSYQIIIFLRFFFHFKQLRTPTTFHSLRDYGTPELAIKFKLLYYNLNKTFFKSSFFCQVYLSNDKSQDRVDIHKFKVVTLY